jgi:hypothetical protein
VTSQASNSDELPATEAATEAAGALRDIGDVPAVEVVTTVALHLMSAAAVKVGLGAPAGGDASDPDAASQLDADPGTDIDLDEARTLITALAGLITAAAPRLGTFHAAPLRDGLKTLQLAFREASAFPDPPGAGPGEDLTGPV